MTDMADGLDPYKVLVGKRLEIARDHKGFKTIQEMADALGVSHDRYSKWIEGKNMIPQRFAAFLEDEWSISMSWLYATDPKRLKLELTPPRRPAHRSQGRQ